MLTFKRKYSTRIARNAAYFTFFILGFIVAITAITNALFPDFVATPLSESVFGRYFVWAHALLILEVVFLIGLGIDLAQKNIITYPISTLTRFEVDAYNRIYSAQFNLPKKKWWYVFLIILTTLIPVLLLFLKYFFLPDGSDFLNTLAYFVGFALMVFFFFRVVMKMRQGSNDQMIEVFNHATKHIPDTTIKMNGNDLAYSTMGAQIDFSLNIDGQFRGQDFKVDYGVSGTRSYRSIIASSKGGMTLVFRHPSSLNFSIMEKKDPIDIFKGPDLDTCFSQRFDLKGALISDFSDRFKTMLLESPRSIFIHVEKGIMVQELANIYILPFYSGQGMILFLDFMSELAAELKKK